MKYLITVFWLLIISLVVAGQDVDNGLAPIQTNTVENLELFMTLETSGWVVFSEDGSLLATVDIDSPTLGSTEGRVDTVFIWDSYAPGYQPIAVIRIESLFVRSLAFSPDNSLLAIGDLRGEILLWDITQSEIRAILRAEQGFITDIAFNTLNSSIAASVSTSDGFYTAVWENMDDESEEKYIAASESIADFSPQNPSILARSTGHFLNFYDVAMNAPLVLIASHEARLIEVEFNPTGSRILTADLHGIKVWDVNNLLSMEGVAENVPSLLEITVSDEEIFAVEVNWQYNLIVAATRNNELIFFDLRTGEDLYHLPIEGIRDISLSPSGDILAVSTISDATGLWGVMLNDTEGE